MEIFFASSNKFPPLYEEQKSLNEEDKNNKFWSNKVSFIFLFISSFNETKEFLFEISFMKFLELFIYLTNLSIAYIKINILLFFFLHLIH